MKKLLLMFFIIFFSMSVHCAYAKSYGYIVKFADGYTPSAELGLTPVNESRKIYRAETDSFPPDIEAYIEHIEPNCAVELIQDVETISLRSLPQDEFYPDQWQLQMINADSAWQIETYGNEIKVAVIDSGCSPHDDLANNILAGKNYLDNSTNVTDTYGHGTHVCGIIAAEMNSIGISGIAPKAKIVPLKCFSGKNDATVDMVVSAIYDAVDTFHCNVINMSFGITGNSSLVYDAIEYASSKNVIIVAAVGNNGNTTMFYPAGYSSVIGVGSVGISGQKSSFSQYNSSVLVVAPGENVKSTSNSNGYVFKQGTSQAAPMVSGIAALVLSMDGNISNAEFMQLLTESCTDLGDEGYDTKYGYGLVDVSKLVDTVLSRIPYYVSPVNTNASETYVYIKNNTQYLLSAVSIFSACENGMTGSTASKNITLLPSKGINVYSSITGSKINHYLWSNLNGMLPLSVKR